MKIGGVKMKTRGFEIAKGFENFNITLPCRSTKNSAGYDFSQLRILKSLRITNSF